MLNYLAAVSGAILAPASAFDSIASASGTGSSGTITFSSIPSNYQHLQIRFSATAVSSGGTATISFNGVGGTSYATHWLIGTGTAAVSSALTSTASIRACGEVSGSDTAAPMVGIIDILDYASTTKNKTVRTLSGIDKNGGGEVDLMSGVFLSTNAISSITLNLGVNWTTDARFALYGIRGA